ESAPEGECLIHDRQNAPGGRIDNNDRSVQRAQRVDGGFADREILAIDFVARGGIFISRFVPGLNVNLLPGSRGSGGSRCDRLLWSSRRWRGHRSRRGKPAGHGRGFLSLVLRGCRGDRQGGGG